MKEYLAIASLYISCFLFVNSNSYVNKHQLKKEGLSIIHSHLKKRKVISDDACKDSEVVDYQNSTVTLHIRFPKVQVFQVSVICCDFFYIYIYIV